MQKLASVLAVALWFPSCRSQEPLPHTGFIDARVASVASQVAGQVVAIPVQEGETVHKGQVLVQLDPKEREVAVAQAEANLERSKVAQSEAEQTFRSTLPTIRGAGADIEGARAALAEAERNFARTKKLVEGHAAPGSELDTARAQLEEQQANLRSLQFNQSAIRGRTGASWRAVEGAWAQVRVNEIALRLAQVQLQQAQITSPFDGVVVARNLQEGEWAAPGTPVITVENRAELWVRLDMGEKELQGVGLGQQAEVRVLALPPATLRGTVMEVGAEGDFALNRDVKRGMPDLRTFRVRVAIDGQNPALRPGMTAEVRFVSQAQEGTHP